MEPLKLYLKEVLGLETSSAFKRLEPKKLPFYIREQFNLYGIRLLDNSIVLAEYKADEALNTLQLEKQLHTLREVMGMPVALVAYNLSALERKRLIQKGINFVVPGKQLFLPELLVDLREHFPRKKEKKDSLTPSSQALLLYHILHRYEKIENLSFKELAQKFGYTQMAITKIADDLGNNELCTIEGTKEKYIHFHGPIPELWHMAKPVLVSPVIKRVYTDTLPPHFLMRCNESALPEYTEMAHSNQEYRAIEKNLFYSLEKANQWSDLNDQEGKYCLEVWKYNPKTLAEGITEETNVDPLSLYLSLTDMQDERIEMALDQIIEKFIW
jgi:hypothetical protein